jgi:dTDP-4-dehydrorhamnose 3,5-epimerase
MQVETTKLEGVFIINNFHSQDERGNFVKTFNKSQFENKFIKLKIEESYFSISHKDVIRGMHFQLPPYDHEKLVFVPKGAIIDVVLDLRKHSKTFGQFISIKLSSENKKSIFIPKGCAHGFKSLMNDSITIYMVATEYNFDSDFGIHFNSFGFDWEIDNPIVSSRDRNLIGFESFCLNTPF